MMLCSNSTSLYDILVGAVKTEAGEVVTLQDVLVFVSGVTAVPPLGFYKQQPEINFSEGRLATASTCSLNLKLPLHPDYTTFRKYMVLSIKGHSGFGQV